MKMRLTIDEEPTFEEISTHAMILFEFDYWDSMFSFCSEERVDMEHTAERMLIAERLAAKQADFA
jgi:hypothetical protein